MEFEYQYSGSLAQRDKQKILQEKIFGDSGNDHFGKLNLTFEE